MIEKRPFDSLGRFEFDWLKARHHFSFGEYFDQKRLGWGALRVWNDDQIAAGGGFPPHPHRDMEIITYVREGAISHKDSVGNAGKTWAGDVQVMSAGTGVRHSEFNHEDEETRIFQIWIIPDAEGGEPRWDAAEFPKEDRPGELVTLASGDPEAEGGLMIRADAKVMGATVKPGEAITYTPKPDRHQYLVPATGSVRVNGVALNARDGAAIRDEAEIRIEAEEEAEIVLVDTR